MFILDTDHLGEYQKGTSSAARRLRQRLDAVDESVATTVITVEDLSIGWIDGSSRFLLRKAEKWP